MRTAFLVLAALAFPSALPAMPPGASYIFPAGGQRGQTIKVRVGGLVTHDRCSWQMDGSGVSASKELVRVPTRWFEGPRLPLPESQRAEDYPQDMTGEVKLSADALLGVRSWRLWTAQGVTPARRFVVGDLPEIVEEEAEGAPLPVAVTLPLTINGRIFPREDVDLWSFRLTRGQSATCAVSAECLGSPLDARLEVLDARGQVIAENEDFHGVDPLIRFTAPADGTYQVRIHDVRFQGGQAHVYRLTISTGPYVEQVYPLGARRGTKPAFRLSGQGMPDTPVALAIAARATTADWHQVEIGGQRSQPFPLDVDDLPEFLIDEQKGKPVTLPAVLNGRIVKPGHGDVWTFEAKKGERLRAELRAGRLGSPLSGLLTISDATGKVLAKAEQGEAGRDDPLLRYTAPVDGTYSLRVADRYRSQGSAAHAYRLRLTREVADFRLSLVADSAIVLRGGEVKLRVQVERMGDHNKPIGLAVQGLPEGVKASPLTIAANQNQADVTLKADGAVKVRVAALRIAGTSEGLTRVALLPEEPGLPLSDHVTLAVAVPTPFKIVGDYVMGNAPRGSVQKRKYRLERGGYQGPLTVTLADRQARHLQGASGPVIEVAPGATEFEYPVTLPPWMEIGRTCRVCVQATGVVDDKDGGKHLVCFSSIAQNEQFVTVVATGQLDIVLDRDSVAARPGQTLTLPFRVARDRELQGPVQVELIVPGHVRGLRCERVQVPAEKGEGELKLTFDRDGGGPYNMPLTVRAILKGKAGPVVAETDVEIAR